MQTWTTVDKSAWGDGPWQDEFDKAQWVDPDTDLDCLVVRGPSGALCGYVGVPPTHPLHGQPFSPDYDDSTPIANVVRSLDVHGGLTFADRCAESDDPATGICHIPEPGRPGDVWWFGFDCAHSRDYAPKHKAVEHGIYEKARAEGDRRTADLFRPGRDWDDVYRTTAYVRGEVERLAKQLACEGEARTPAKGGAQRATAR